MKSLVIDSIRHSTFFISFFILVNYSNAQSPNASSKFPCYTIATTENGTSILYELDPAANQWRVIGKIDRNNIKALAIDTIANLLYSVDGNKLGTINPITAQFYEIGNIGSGNGIAGTITLNNIYGLTHGPGEKLLYATHRVPSFNSNNNTAIANSNDILFKINPATGKVVKNAFDFGDDYVEMDEITNSTLSVPTLYDVNDIAYDHEFDELYVLNGYQTPGNVITINDLSNGNIDVNKAVLLKPSIGMTLDSKFNLFFTTIPPPAYGDIYKVNLQASGVNKVGSVDAQLEGMTHFNCLDCIKNKNFVDILNCQNTIYINKYGVVKNSYKAKSNLYSNTDLFNTTTYKAGNSVTLSNYFSVPANVNFTAMIESCN